MGVLKSEGDMNKGIVGLDFNPGEKSYLDVEDFDPSNVFGGRNGIIMLDHTVKDHWSLEFDSW